MYFPSGLLVSNFKHFKMSIKTLIYSLLVLTLFNACKEEDSFAPDESFLRILDDRDFNASYDPIGVSETQDGSALILTAVEIPDFSFSGSNVLLVDSIGEVVSSIDLVTDLVAPVGDFIQIGNTHYYASMNRQSLQVHLIPVSEEGTLGSPIPVNGGLRYPLALSKTSTNQLLLLSYDPEDRLSVISIINTDGSVAQSAGYSIGTANDVEPIIFNHFTNPFSTLPFFVGEAANGTYYFNGFFNFTLSLVFTNFGEDPTGVLQGQQTLSGARSILHLTGQTFTMMGYQFDENYLMPQVDLPVNSIESSVDFFRGQIPEIRPNAPAKSILMPQGDGTNRVVTVSETENRQTILYIHDDQGALLGIKLLGSLNPFTFDDIILTKDEGLLILGTTFLSSRFERIYLSKIPAKEIELLVN